MGKVSLGFGVLLSLGEMRLTMLGWCIGIVSLDLDHQMDDLDHQILIWTRGGKYFEVSDCGLYTISAASNGKRWTFQAWKRGRPPDLLGTFKTSKEAKDCADRIRLESMGGSGEGRVEP